MKYLVLALILTALGCTTWRSSDVRREKKASKLTQRARFLCPQCFTERSDTHWVYYTDTVRVPGIDTVIPLVRGRGDFRTGTVQVNDTSARVVIPDRSYPATYRVPAVKIYATDTKVVKHRPWWTWPLVGLSFAVGMLLPSAFRLIRWRGF